MPQQKRKRKNKNQRKLFRKCCTCHKQTHVRTTNTSTHERVTFLQHLANNWLSD